MSVGVIYKYYDNKNDLFLECVHFALITLQNLLDDVLDNEDDFELCLRKIIQVSVHSSDYEEGIKINKMYNTISSTETEDFSKPLAYEIEAVSSKVYKELISKAQKEGKCVQNANPSLFAFFFDSILMMVQFSYSCDYFKERLRLYCGDEIFENKQLLEDQLFLFMRSAFGVA